MRIFLMIIFAMVVANGQAQSPVTYNIMPQPKTIVPKNGKFRLTDKFRIGVLASEKDILLYAAVNRMQMALVRRTGLIFGNRISVLQTKTQMHR